MRLFKGTTGFANKPSRQGSEQEELFSRVCLDRKVVPENFAVMNPSIKEGSIAELSYGCTKFYLFPNCWPTLRPQLVILGFLVSKSKNMLPDLSCPDSLKTFHVCSLQQEFLQEIVRLATVSTFY